MPVSVQSCKDQFPDDLMFNSIKDAMNWLRDNCVVIPDGITVDILVSGESSDLRVEEETILDNPYGDRINILSSKSVDMRKTIALDDNNVPDNLNPLISLSNHAITMSMDNYKSKIKIDTNKTLVYVYENTYRKQYLKLNHKHSMSCKDESNNVMYMIDSDNGLLTMFDPVDKSHTIIDDLPLRIMDGGMTFINSKIYMFGGTQIGQYSDNLYEYDLVSKKLTILDTTGTAPTPTNYLTLVSHNNNLYAYGGYTTNGYVYKFDLSANVWSLDSTNNITSRYAHTATVFNDKMYVTGGRGHNLDNRIYFFDLITKVWGVLSLTGAKIYTYPYSVASYNNGKLVIHGGYDSYYGTVTSKSYNIVFTNPTTAVATDNGNHGTPMSTHVGELLDDSGMSVLFTFYDQDISVAFHDSMFIDLYNTQEIKYSHTTTIIGSKIYLIGGVTNYINSGGTTITYPCTRIHEYDILTKKSLHLFDLDPAYGTKLYHHTTVPYNGKLYSYGGTSSISSSKAYLYEFDPINKTQILLSTHDNSNVQGHTAVMYNDKMYVLGHQSTTDIGSNFIYCDFISGIWNNDVTDFHYPIKGHTSVIYNDKMYVFGGYDYPDELIESNELWVYDFLLDTWNQLESCPISAKNHCCSVLENKKRMVVIFDGGINYYYDFVSKHWELYEHLDIISTFTESITYDDEIYIPYGRNQYNYERSIRILNKEMIYTINGVDYGVDELKFNYYEIPMFSIDNNATFNSNSNLTHYDDIYWYHNNFSNILHFGNVLLKAIWDDESSIYNIIKITTTPIYINHRSMANVYNDVSIKYSCLDNMSTLYANNVTDDISVKNNSLVVLSGEGT